MIRAIFYSFLQFIQSFKLPLVNCSKCLGCCSAVGVAITCFGDFKTIPHSSIATPYIFAGFELGSFIPEADAMTMALLLWGRP
jgi:hypothetical protein